MQLKVKGISVSVFTEEDTANLSQVGNSLFNSKYMARYGSQSAPTSDDINKFKVFLRQKYVEKKWFTDIKRAVTAPVPSPSSASVIEKVEITL